MANSTPAMPSRRERRAAYRQIKKQVSSVQWAQFSKEARTWPRMLYWKNAPWQVFAHIYTRCPTLTREWAGTLKEVKWTTEARARVATKGVCSICYYRWRTGEEFA